MKAVIIIVSIIAAIEIYNVIISNKYGCKYIPYFISITNVIYHYIKLRKEPMAYVNWQYAYSKGIIVDKKKYINEITKLIKAKIDDPEIAHISLEAFENYFD